ncbi:MAG: hypothetical protein ACFE8B_07995 [Candidatus Hermodarchaeota archaeon]
MSIDIENLILVISTLIAATLFLIGGIITFLNAIKRKKPLAFLFSASWILQAIFWYLDSAAHLFYSIYFMRIAFILQSIGVPCMFIFLELIKQENVNPIKLILLALIETIFLMLLFMPGAMEIIPGYGVHFIGLTRFFQIIWLIYYVCFYLSWSYQTFKKAPQELKRLVSQLLFGSILFSLVTTVFYAIGTINRMFNPLGFIIHGIGALITIIVILKDPAIIYILPFKAYRLTVFETRNGITLIKHDWAELRNIDENVFSMLIQATRSVLNEIIDKGEVRKIDMDKAVLLVQQDVKYPVVSVLVTSRSCKSLRYGLKTFHDQFVLKYASDFENIKEPSKFKEAENLIEKIFEFVPEYLKKP